MGKDVAFVHKITTAWVWFLWMLYPVCWGISEGGNVIAPDSEFIFFGILDCMLIPVTTAFLLFRHWTIDPERLGLRMRTYNDPISRHGIFHAEKPLSNGQSDEAIRTGTGELPAKWVAIKWIIFIIISSSSSY
jgi:bacteriorhodopsin